MKKPFFLILFFVSMLMVGCDSLNTDDGSDDAPGQGAGGDQSLVEE